MAPDLPDGGDDEGGAGGGGASACAADPGWGPLGVGAPVKHLTGMDHEGNEWRLCWYEGEVVVLNICAVWCAPCNQIIDFLVNDGQPFEPVGLWESVRSAVDGGRFTWVEIVAENQVGANPELADLQQWHDAYAHERIPVLRLDSESLYGGDLGIVGYPIIHAVDRDLRWLAISDWDDWWQGLLETVLEATEN